MKTLTFHIKRLLALGLLSFIYQASITFAHFRKSTLKRSKKLNESIVVIGVFHNPNWFTSHVTPLTKANIGKVILVTDEPIKKLDNLIYFCPPKALSKIFSRAGAKFLWAIYAGYKFKPDLFMGYHIFPAGAIASICGHYFKKPCAYQVTSGKLELDGGGYNAENRLLVSLGKHSSLIEKLALKLTKTFDLLVVRGSQAEQYLRDKGVKAKISIVTGSTDVHQQSLIKSHEKDIDLIFVGRMTETKRPELFVETVHIIKQSFPDIKAVMAGDGPDYEKIVELISSLDLDSNIKTLGQVRNIEEWLKRSKVYLLTSRWEGVSISMLEAMACGAVPVVTNVGDLKDIVQHGHNGFLINNHIPNDFSIPIVELLNDLSALDTMASEAANTSYIISDISSVSSRWHEVLRDVT